jgi:hypothetical protein
VARGGVGTLRGLDRVVAGPQLFLLARGEQQRIIDARAQAEHAGQGRREAGDVRGGGRPHERAEAEPEAGERGEQGVARSPQAAQDGDQQDDRDHEADDLADREAAGRGAVDRLAGHRDADAGLLDPGGRVLELLACRRVELLGRLVVVDDRVRRAAVLGQLQVIDRRHVRLVGDLRKRGLDRALGELAVVAAEHERRRRARLRGEPLLEQVLGLLGLDARDGEVVLERAAGRGRAGDQDEEGEEDRGGREPGTAAHERGGRCEEGGHGAAL